MAGNNGAITIQLENAEIEALRELAKEDLP